MYSWGRNAKGTDTSCHCSKSVPPSNPMNFFQTQTTLFRSRVVCYSSKSVMRLSLPTRVMATNWWSFLPRSFAAVRNGRVEGKWQEVAVRKKEKELLKLKLELEAKLMYTALASLFLGRSCRLLKVATASRGAEATLQLVTFFPLFTTTSTRQQTDHRVRYFCSDWYRALAKKNLACKWTKNKQDFINIRKSYCYPVIEEYQCFYHFHYYYCSKEVV